MKIISATTRITLGLVSLTMSVWLVAYALGMLPDRRQAEIDGRAALCENVAWNCSLLASRNDTQAIELALEGLVRRNKAVQSAGVRRPDGTVLLAIGPHVNSWTLPPGKQSTPSQMRVPIFAGTADWGSIEVRFRDSAEQAGFAAWRLPPVANLGLFFAGASYLLYFFYLQKMLKQLDPSRVIPRRVRQTLDTLAEGLLVLDKNERILLANQAFAQSIGAAVEDLMGRKASDLPWESDVRGEGTEGFPWQRALHDDALQMDDLLTIVDRNQQRRTLKVSAMAVYSDDGERRGAMASFDDVTEIEKNREQLREMLETLSQSRDEIHRHNLELERIAAHDPLTDCLNRRAFFTQLETHWNLALRQNGPLACIMFDLDHFKLVNDTHGHQAGDMVLEMAAGLLRSGVRSGDLVCRYGGEEFCICLPDTELEEAFVVAEQLRQSVEKQDFNGLSVTASVGVSARSLQGASPQEMIDQADKCLYVAKREGRNRVIRFDLAADSIAQFEQQGEAPAQVRDEDSTSTDDHEPAIPFHAVTALLSALAYRDLSTADHSRRVAELCVATARRLMSASESHTLEIAALLHDIGKIGVPDSILLKPGKLTDEEWEVMNSHERIGAEIMQSTFACLKLTEILRTYRSWYGGNDAQPGAPAGEDISMSARILAVADAYDAMTHQAAYREAISREQAFAELRSCAGRQFDPEVVERLIDAVGGRDPRKSSPAIEASKSAAVSFAAQIERLSAALENQDRSGIAVLANRLNRTAVKFGSPQIAAAAAHLEAAAGEDQQLQDLVLRTNELVDLCRSAQRAWLNEAATPASQLLALPQEKKNAPPQDEKDAPPLEPDGPPLEMKTMVVPVSGFPFTFDDDRSPGEQGEDVDG
ncbi:diguanylate cyclase [Lignipirellula cremea]|uniref:diguanylate cyclase n=1 Tax=Lignipirellula cremea TaxID=2528010 RepID=UPI0011A57FBD|nr:diguanylate cyclase [Lignipirellula cremea]